MGELGKPFLCTISINFEYLLDYHQTSLKWIFEKKKSTFQRPRFRKKKKNTTTCFICNNGDFSPYTSVPSHDASSPLHLRFPLRSSPPILLPLPLKYPPHAKAFFSRLTSSETASHRYSVSLSSSAVFSSRCRNTPLRLQHSPHVPTSPPRLSLKYSPHD